jgi:hypothetical protein
MDSSAHNDDTRTCRVSRIGSAEIRGFLMFGRCLCVAILTVGAVLAPAAVARAAEPVHCGAVLTASVRLTQNLSCKSGVGLTLNGDITLDLRGHRLIGPGKASSEFATSLGVALGESGTPRIQNGLIQGWGTGAGPSDDNSGHSAAAVERISFADDGTGLFGNDSTFDLSHTRFARNTDNGISGLATFVTVRYSVFHDNGRAISLSDGGSIALSRSVVEHNDIGVSCQEVGCVISLSALRGNSTAISAFFARGKFWANDVDGNDVGFDISNDLDPGYAHELSHNLVRNDGTGVLLSDAGTAYLHDNLFTTNAIGFSVPVTGSPPTALLVHNVFIRNRNGALILSAGTSLGRNRAVANRGWGIYAVKATDLGGNVSRGNGLHPQCVGIACQAHN